VIVKNIIWCNYCGFVEQLSSAVVA